MNKHHKTIPYAGLLQRVGKVVSQHILYGNILFLIVVVAWLYIFITTYYIGPKDDFAFIASKSSEIYDITLNRKQFNDVYTRYFNKQRLEGEAPSLIVHPF